MEKDISAGPTGMINQSGPPSKLVPNTPVGPNQNDSLHWVSDQNFQNFGLNGKCPWFPYAPHPHGTKPLVLPQGMVPKFGTLREQSLTIGGGRAGKFWRRAVFFGAPIWGGP